MTSLLRGILTVLTFISLFIFPWPLTIVLALLAGLEEPLVPFALGLAADTLYSPHLFTSVPWCTIAGLATSVALVVVRSQLRSGSMRG